MELQHETDELEPYKTKFSEIVEKAVSPVMQMRERGVTPIYQGGRIADTGLSIASNTIRFELFKPDHTELLGFGIGTGVPNATHAVRINENHEFYRTRQRSTIFCLTQEGEFKRMMALGGDKILPPTVSRDIELGLADALVEFLTSPHLNLDKVDIILALSDDEQARIDAQIQARREHQEQMANERRIQTAHRGRGIWLRPRRQR